MSDVIVSPTTSRDVIDTSLSEKEKKDFIKKDIPVLLVRANLVGEFTKDQIKSSVMGIDKTVEIDHKNRHILIGTVTDSLINTENLKNNETTQRFFKRWIEEKTLFLAFNCFCMGKFVCCIKGLWADKEWKNFLFVEEFTIRSGLSPK